MFKSSTSSPYDDIVVKATDENLTAENWELIITLCDKVTDEGDAGARNVIAAVVKRLAHRNPNVQLYALALAESLTKNCGIELHREVASKSFTHALEKIITDRTTHDKVKRRALGLIAMWAADFENNPSLGLVEECYTSLKARGYKFELPDEAPPVRVDDDLRRKEEEELQRALEMSIHDKGGREQWSNYLASSNGAGGSGSGSSSALHAAQPSQHRPDTHRQQVNPETSRHDLGSPSAATYTHPAAPVGSSTQPKTEPNSPTSQSAQVPTTSPQQSVLVTRVRALHKFQASEPGELAFEKGDVIKVVDRIYKDWWRGQLRGRTGIFPVNYVEALPDPTPAEIAKEGEQEAAIFSQAANIDKLLNMLRDLDPEKDNLADNEEIQELYRTSMSLRPKIVKLIDRYNQKKAELVSMNDTFIRAKTIFDRMMEESLSRHTAEYGSPFGPEYGPPRQPTVWNATAYEQGPGYPQQFRQSMYSPQPFQQQPTPGLGAYPPNTYPQTPQSPVSHPQHMPGIHSQAQPASLAPTSQQFQPPQQQYYQQPQQETVVNGYGSVMQHGTQPQQATPEHSEESQAGSSSQQSGPPYDYDPQGQYPDPNATAWARYYAQGGKDLQGAVYFKSIPGVKEFNSDVVPANELDGTPGTGSRHPAPLDTTHIQQQQHIQQAPGYPIQEAQVTSNPPLSPSSQTHSIQSFAATSYGQQPYPQHDVQSSSPGGALPPNAYGFPVQTGAQHSVGELQRSFSSHNLQA